MTVSTEKSVPIPVSRPEKVLLLVVSLMVLLVFGGGLAILAPAFLSSMSRGAAMVVGAGAGVILTVMLAGGIWFQWSRAGGPRMQTAVQYALSSRQLPSQVDVRLWSVLLDYQEASVRRTKYVVAVVVVVAAIALYVALTSGNSELAQAGWVFGVIFLGLGIWGPIEARKRGANVKILREQLDARSE